MPLHTGEVEEFRLNLLGTLVPSCYAATQPHEEWTLQPVVTCAAYIRGRHLFQSWLHRSNSWPLVEHD